MRLKCLISITVLVLCSLVLPSSTALEKTRPEKTKKDEKQQTPLYVKLNVVVTDANHQSVDDVTKDSFRIFEDDVPQTLSLFEKKAKPAGFVLAVDTSLSLRAQISIVIATAKFIVTSAAPDEKIMIERFISSNKIERVQDFTSDHVKLLSAIDWLYLEGGQSAIVDAISLANDSIEAFTRDKGSVRRPLIVITDGEDRHSYFTEQQLFEQLRKTGAQVFVVAFQQGLQTKLNREKATKFLNRVAQESVGNVYYPTSVPEIERDVKQMMLEMRTAYVIGYESTNPGRNGKFRRVRVEVENPPDAPKRFAFVRAGYTAPKD